MLIVNVKRDGALLIIGEMTIYPNISTQEIASLHMTELQAGGWFFTSSWKNSCESCLQFMPSKVKQVITILKKDGKGMKKYGQGMFCSHTGYSVKHLGTGTKTSKRAGRKTVYSLAVVS